MTLCVGTGGGKKMITNIVSLVGCLAGELSTLDDAGEEFGVSIKK